MIRRRLFMLILVASILLIGCQKSAPSSLNSTTMFNLNESLSNVHRLERLIPVGKTINGDLIAREAEQANSTTNSIWLVSQEGTRKKEIAKSSQGKVIYSAITTNNWVIYAEAENDPIKSDWKIIGINIDSLETKEIDKAQIKGGEIPFITPTEIGPYLACSKEFITWMAYEPSPSGTPISVIRLYNIKTSENRAIDEISVKDGAGFGFPSIDNEFLVYHRGKIDPHAAGFQGTIVFRNLRTGEMRELDHGLQVSSPVIKYPYVAWNQKDTIRLINLESNVIKTLGSGWSPSLNNNLVAWAESGFIVNAYDLNKGETVTIRSSNALMGRITGDIFYWFIRSEGPIVEWMDISSMIN